MDVARCGTQSQQRTTADGIESLQKPTPRENNFISFSVTYRDSTDS